MPTHKVVSQPKFLQMLKDAPDDVLLKSRMHCHAMDVSSVVLKDDGGRLTRMFLAWPENKLYLNAWPTDHLVVGIHNHRYDISLTPFIGFISNPCFRYSNKDCGTLLDEYEFVSGVESGTFVARKCGQRYLRLRRTPGLLHEKIFMQAHELHTVATYGIAAWLVEEGKTRLGKTKLFSNVPVLADPRMYQSFESPDAVREHCHQFLNLPELQ